MPGLKWGAPWTSKRSSLGWVITGRIAIIFLLFELIQFFTIQAFGRRQFRAIERTNLLDRTRQVFLTFDQEANFLRSLTVRTAMWGDTYDYVLHPTRAYLDRNFGGNWAMDNGVDFVLIVGPDGRRLWSSEGYAAFTSRLPGPFSKEHFDPDDPGIFHPADGPRPVEWFTGLVGSGENVWIYCAHTINDYNTTRPPRGMLLLGRRLYRNVLSSYTYGRGDSLQVVPLAKAPEATDSDDRRIVKEFPTYGGTRTSIRREGNALVSYTPLSDMHGKPLAALRLSIPRMDERVGTEVVWLMSGSLFCMLFLSLGAVVVLVRSTVIRPINRMASFFKAGGQDRMDILRACAQRSDEIGILAERAEALIEQVRGQKVELENQANTDRLTGLANRRFFDTHIQAELRRLLRQRRQHGQDSRMAMAMIDVDHFKLFNDTNGHMAGDACLRAVAETIQSCIFRPGDLACRFGGEEFLLMLPDTDEEGARVVAESVRASIEWAALPHPSSPVSSVVTVSIGITSAEVTEAFEVGNLIERADQALYAAKQGGRNRVVGSSSLV